MEKEPFISLNACIFKFWIRCIRGLSQITFEFFWIFWPRTPLVCTFYVANYTIFWPPTYPKCKRNFWKAPYVHWSKMGFNLFSYISYQKSKQVGNKIKILQRIDFFREIQLLLDFANEKWAFSFFFSSQT